MIYPPSQKPPIWSIDPGVIAYNCQRAGMPHPVGAWPFWEGGGALARDYSGHGNHEASNGSPEWMKDGLNFDGANDYININSVVDTFDISKSWTMSSRLLVNAETGNDMAFFGFGNDTTTAESIGLRYDEPNNTLKIFSNGKTGGEGSYLTVGVFYNFVLTWDGTKFTAYMNGIYDYAVTPSSAMTWTSINTFIIGGQISFGAFLNQANILIDTINIFNTTLSASQIKFISDNPYFMYQIPEELYGYVAGAPPTGNPFWYYNMLRRRN